MRPEGAIADNSRPFTGAEYLQSLRDGREFWIYGERVDDVTTHPALRATPGGLSRRGDNGMGRYYRTML